MKSKALSKWIWFLVCVAVVIPGSAKVTPETSSQVNKSRQHQYADTRMP